MFIQGEAIKHPRSPYILQVIMMLDDGRVLACKLGKVQREAYKYALDAERCERVPIVLPEAGETPISEVIAGIPDRATVGRLNPALSAANAFEYFYYEKPTGKVMWRKAVPRQHSIGDYVRVHSDAVYPRVCVEGQRAYLHRVVWLLVTGIWPTGLVYHIDGDRTNNNINNLAMLP